MATLTIRNLDEGTKQTLRLRAARRGVSLEEEVRGILRSVTAEAEPPRIFDNLYDAIRDLVEPYGGFELEIPERSYPVREPPKFE
jgi:plasmid stability protein